MSMVTVRNQRLELNRPNIRQWPTLELLFRLLLNSLWLRPRASQLQSRPRDCRQQLMLLAYHLLNLLLVHRAPNKCPKEMLSSANMVDMDLVGFKNPPCPRNHLMDLASKPRLLKVLLKGTQTNSHSLSHSHSLGLSLPHRTSSLRIIQPTPNNVMPIVITSNSMDNKVHRASRTVQHPSRDHTVGMVVPKPKGHHSFHRVLLSRRSHVMPLLERAKRAATPLQTQLLRLNSQ
jgi:hypothetical protein